MRLTDGNKKNSSLIPMVVAPHESAHFCQSHEIDSSSAADDSPVLSHISSLSARRRGSLK